MEIIIARILITLTVACAFAFLIARVIYEGMKGDDE